MSFDPKRMTHKQARRLVDRPLPGMGPGQINRIRQRLRLGEGRIAWRNTVAAFAALAQFDQADRNQKREERVRPEHIDVLASKQVTHANGHVETVVTSERRREHWPDLGGGTYDYAKLAVTERRLETQRIKSAVTNAVGRFFGR